MKKIIVIILVVIVAIVSIWYLLGTPSTPLVTEPSDPRNATYIIDGQPVTLVGGSAETEAAPGSASKIITTYFGNEVEMDIDDDGREDSVFLLTQSTGGSGTFFYVVAALHTKDGWKGSQGLLLGDRIAPQTTEKSQNPDQKKVIVVNYFDHAADQPMSEQPSVGKSIWLKFDPMTMSFGEVAQNFEGEADPGVMSLTMKPWTWVSTTYNTNLNLQPEKTDAFTVTFTAGDTNEGRVSVTTDCNTMSGTYTNDGINLSFGQLASTMRFCEDSQEQEFSKMLGQIQSYSFTSKGELQFALKIDNGVSVFR